MANEHPIPFKAEMVRAILDGRKTQTRRVIKPQPTGFNDFESGEKHWPVILKNGENYSMFCPYGKVGDLLWVRETWACGTHMGQLMKAPKELGDDMWVAWKENYNDDAPAIKQLAWKSPIHMPKWACRTWLEITQIRVERLLDISDEDCFAEGMDRNQNCEGDAYTDFLNFFYGINKKLYGTKNENSWLWVIEFKRMAGTVKNKG